MCSNRAHLLSLSCTFAAALVTMLASPRAWSAPVSFQGLGHLPGRNYSEALAVSSDGSVVVGSVRSPLRSGSYDYEAFRWTRTDGMQGLGFLPGFERSYAYGVSSDGSTIVGRSYEAADVRSFAARAFRWTSAGGMVALPQLSGNEVTVREGAAAYAISGDASTIVGQSTYSASRWTSAGGVQRLKADYSDAFGVSADGSVVVGQAYADSYDPEAKSRPFRWTSDGGLQDLGLLREDDYYAVARAVSADGSVVAGSSGSKAFRWTKADGMQGLGFLPGLSSSSYANGVSGDGSIIVGLSNDAAFIWDAEHGMRNLQQMLVSDYGLDLNGWMLQSATAIGADGRAIVGFGTHLGQTEAWVATIPEPSSLALVGLGGLLLLVLSLRQTQREAPSNQVV